MKKSKFVAALNAAKEKIGEIIANKMLGETKTVICLKGIEGIAAEQRIILASMLDVDAMFRAKKYDMLIRLGQLQEFVNRGLEAELIARYPLFRRELGNDLLTQAVSLINEDMLERYIKDSSSNEFGFFIFHPLGLKVLAEHEFTGFIAAHEAEFRNIAEDFPEEFRISENAHRDYVTLLNRVLD